MIGLHLTHGKDLYNTGFFNRSMHSWPIPCYVCDASDTFFDIKCLMPSYSIELLPYRSHIIEDNKHGYNNDLHWGYYPA